ncbi:MAG TPA: helix-turn-helix transcriptional regulator, partial [Vicinamibacteria bacterium]|nr:helix-turn-helix transcriptional regulator [Vicinamibacteria bacterium]
MFSSGAPMKPTVFLVLLALGARERHGYGLVKAIEGRAPGTRIEPANLYRVLRAMKREGLIAESARRPDPELDDARRRYFRITEKGVRAARAEADRLSKLVRIARKLRPSES